jgi:hypothetical protein
MDIALYPVYNEFVLNCFAPDVRPTCHTVWYLEHLTVNVAKGISWPLLSNPHFKSQSAAHHTGNHIPAPNS